MSDDIVWTTKDGDKLTMKEITNSHLCSIVRLLRRKKEEGLEKEPFKGGSDNLRKLLIEGYDSTISVFEKEARRRHITIPKEKVPA